MSTELDYMEYATDGAAQAAYVSDAGSISNVVLNADFETWSDATHCTNWNLYLCTSDRESTIKHGGNYSAKITATAINAEFYSDQFSGFTNKQCVWGAWVYAEVPNTVRLLVTDTVAYAYFSNFHPGDSAWHFLHIIHINPGNSDIMRFEFSVTNGNIGYIDDSIGYVMLSLNVFFEETIKTQGSYALKGIATITASLNKTLTRTIT